MTSCTYEAKSINTFKLIYRLNLILTSLEPKVFFLLTSLLSSIDKVVDNVQSKDKTTWKDVYNHLFDLKSDTSTGESVYKVQHSFGSLKFTSKNKGNNSTYGRNIEKECMFCKKKNRKYIDHIQNKCHKLKQRKEKNKKGEQANMAVAPTTALIVSEPSLSSNMQLSSLWILESGASSFITSNPVLYICLKNQKGFIQIGDDFCLDMEETGIVILNCYRYSSTLSIVTFCDCLYISSLGQTSLLSKRKCQKKSFVIVGYNNMKEV